MAYSSQSLIKFILIINIEKLSVAKMFIVFNLIVIDSKIYYLSK